MTQQVPDEVKAAVEELAAKIASGEIVTWSTTHRRNFMQLPLRRGKSRAASFVFSKKVR